MKNYKELQIFRKENSTENWAEATERNSQEKYR